LEAVFRIAYYVAVPATAKQQQNCPRRIGQGVKMKEIRIVVIVLLVLGFALAAVGAEPNESKEKERYWVEAMAQVHKKFTGQKGTFAHFGDSITVTLAFWTPLSYSRKNAPEEMEKAYKLASAYMKKECWRDWKGAEFGNEGSQTIRWADENIDKWLKRLNPEVALIMFGTNDLHSVELEEYVQKMRQVVQKCLDNGTVVILSTIPPRHGLADSSGRSPPQPDKSAVYAEAVRKIAKHTKVPLIDYHSEILKRRPQDWDGAMDKFSDYKDYDVPTLLSRDGIHPSHPNKYQDDYSQEALGCNGYSLRNYLVLTKYAQVLKALKLARQTNSEQVSEPKKER
jgi:lysophospholipase L1-like esterase